MFSGCSCEVLSLMIKKIMIPMFLMVISNGSIMDFKDPKVLADISIFDSLVVVKV